MLKLFRRIRNFILIKRFPFLECHNVWTNSKIKHNYDYTWLDDMPKGWRKKFGISICQDIKNLFIETGYSEFVYEYRITQIKEKYGQLRWYDNGVPQHISSLMSELLTEYEYKSSHTCMICGNKGEIDYNEYWLSALCTKHRQKLNNK